MASPATPPPPPALTPFFTLITPHALAPAGPESPSTTHPDVPHIHPHVHYIFADDVPPPPPPAESRIRAVTVELDRRHEVVRAVSHSGEFMVTAARVGVAPVLGSAGGAAAAAGGGMLVIEGVELEGARGEGGEGVEELVGRWEGGMEGLRRVVGAWEQGQERGGEESAGSA